MAISFAAVELLRPKLTNYDSDLRERKPPRQQWPCILCTYLNDNNYSKCKLCLTPRTIGRLPMKRRRKKPPKPKRSKSLIPRQSFLKLLQCSISNELNENHIVARECLESPSTNIYKKHRKKSMRKTTANKRKYTKPKKNTKLYPLPATAARFSGLRPMSNTSIHGATNFSFAQCVHAELKTALKNRKKSLIVLEKHEKTVQKHESTLLEILKHDITAKDVMNTITDARCDVLCDFLPLIAFTLCQCDDFLFKMKLLNQLRNRIIGQSDLRQAVKYFIRSYHDIECVKSVFKGICNDDVDDCDEKDGAEFWGNIIKRKCLKEDECIEIGVNTILRDPIQQLSSPLRRIVIKKVLNSKSKPLLIDCYGTYDLSSRFILKYGDDLRKDKSCLLVFKWMNHLFVNSDKLKNCNVKILTYNVIPMNTIFGCIQLIPNCIPLRNILCLKSEIKNKGKLLNNLIASAAASYISSYVMGIRDRHFDNILIRTTDCTLFHIDMGYVLGDTITGLDANKLGITKQFYDILGKDNYIAFVDLCIVIFCELRRYHEELINFACFAFSYVYDYAIIRQYISKQLRMNESEKKSVHCIKTQLQNAPFNKQTILKNVIHKYATR